MGIAPDVIEHLLRPGERRLGVNNPVALFRESQMPGERRSVLQRFQRAEEPEFAGIERFLERFQKQPPEQRGQNPDGQKEVRPAGTQRSPSGEGPPPGTTQCRCG